MTSITVKRTGPTIPAMPARVKSTLVDPIVVLVR
jgi:hypothetical protein